jgi:hypothetical protein
MSLLKPDLSVVIAIATGVFTIAVYDKALPSTAEIHATDALDGSVDAARKKASWMAAGAIAGVTLLTRDPAPLIIGGVTLFALDFHARHANASDPATGDLVSPAPGYAQTDRG